MEKNSFSLLETVLSLLILSVLVSGFIQFTYKKNPKTTSINSVKNLLILNQTHENIHLTSLAYTLNNSTFELNSGNTLNNLIYNDENITLQRMFVNQPNSQPIAFKVFE